MRLSMIPAVLALSLAAGTPALAADSEAGEGVARSACASCHQLPDGSGAPVGPALSELAADAAPFSEEDIRNVLEQPQHQPARALLDLETDVALLMAYLNSLE